MSTYFADSSALGRRYLVEVGSAWVLSWMGSAAGNVVIVSDLAPIELFSAFARRQREGTLAAANALALQSNVLRHMDKEYVPVALDSPVLTEARRLVSQYTLRTLDAIQLSCALRATALLGEHLTFVSADHRLLTAAAAEGFATDNPLLHP